MFLNARGGSGKTHALNTLLAATRSLEDEIVSIALAVASSGIPITKLTGGRTAHSRFKIPLEIQELSSLSISFQSALAELSRVSKVVVWDEAPMIHRFSLEALDRSFRDIMDTDVVFGGKSIVLAGDSR